MTTMTKNSNDEKLSVLLLGSGDVLESDVDCRLEVCDNAVDAVDVAAGSNFDAVAVVVAEHSRDLEKILGALREVAPYRRIILLCRMHEEPRARKLTDSKDAVPPADDYLITPVSPREFLQTVKGYAGEEQTMPSQEAVKPDKAEKTPDSERVGVLEQLATEDDLTGLKNRRYMREFARQIVERARRLNVTVTLMMFDIDDFKHYNDQYGHSAGDEILIQVGRLMRRCCRRHDIVGRVGGDEFAVIFWDNPRNDAELAESERRQRFRPPDTPIFIAERFRNEVAKAEFSLLGPDGRGELSVSGGLASFPRDVDNVEGLFTEADKALLEAKRSGKNRIYLVGRPIDAAHQRR